MKTPTSLYLSFLAFFLSLTFTVSTNDLLKQQAQTWVYTYVFYPDGKPRISNHDIQSIGNLIYFSWARSAMTIKAQKELLDILDTMWKEWQNVTQSRLDPSVDQPYSIPSEKQNLTSYFWKLADQYHMVGMTYTYAIKMILEKQLIPAPLALDGIADMRDKARQTVLKSILDIRKQLGQFFQVSDKGHQLVITPEQDDQFPEGSLLDEIKKGINLLNYIYSYIPQLAANSFIKANSLQNSISEEGWHALKTIQDVGNQTWKAIEDSRIEFYSAYYTALYEAISTNGLPNDCRKIMFNEQGIVQTGEQKLLLPDPQHLALSI